MKDKRTKEQILKLLDNAIEQEERLLNKINTLETDLSECRKKVEDPRHEITEEAMPASKVSFRIDYYRTKEHGPLKGIIEHLPSRQNKAFEGEGQLVIGHFMSRFLHEESGKPKKKKGTSVEKLPPPEIQVQAPEDTSAFFPDEEIAAEALPENEVSVIAVEEYMAIFTDEKEVAAQQSEEIAAEVLPEKEVAVIEVEAYVAIFADEKEVAAQQSTVSEMESPTESMEKTAIPQAQEEGSAKSSSRLLNKLKANLDLDAAETGEQEETIKSSISTPAKQAESAKSTHAERVLAKINILQEDTFHTSGSSNKRTDAEVNRPRLLQRLQEEYKSSIEQVASSN